MNTQKNQMDEQEFVLEFYDEIGYVSIPLKKYKNFQQQDEDFFLSIGEYSNGSKKRFYRSVVIILASGKITFSFGAPISAMEEAPAYIERVIFEEKEPSHKKNLVNRTTNAPDAPDPGDDDDNKNNPEGSDWKIFVVVIGFLAGVGYTCYQEEINDFCSKVYSNLAEFFGREKIYEPQIIVPSDGLNFVNLEKLDVKTIMLELPVLIYRAQKERIHQAVFHKFNLTKPIHLVAEEIKKYSLDKINELAINPVLQEKMKNYVDSVIKMILANNPKERREHMKKSLEDFADVFGNLRTAPDVEIKKIAPAKIARSINVQKLYDEIIGKNTPKSDE